MRSLTCLEQVQSMGEQTSDSNWVKVLEALSRRDEASVPELAGLTLLTPSEVRSSLSELHQKGLTTLKQQEPVPVVAITGDGRQALAVVKRQRDGLAPYQILGGKRIWRFGVP